MNISTIKDSVENLRESARETYADLKKSARDRIGEPLSEAGRSLAGAARDGAERAMDCSRRSVDRTEAWITSNPFTAIGVAFGVGLLGAVCLLTRCRR